MAYTKQSFEDGQVLTAAHLNHMETGIKLAHDLAASGSGGSGGKGISSIKKTAGTGAPGTKDTYTITYTDGTTTTYTVYNGKDGASGQTPVKGVDYWTETERQDMAEEAASLVDVDPTPDYIVAEAERVAQNVQNVRTARTLVFPVLSDMHLYEGDPNPTHQASELSARYAGMGIREMKKRISMDGVVLLGDYSWMSSDDYSSEQVKKDITACKEALGLDDNEIWCVGNHDVCYGHGCDRSLTDDEMYAYIGANADGVKPYEAIERGYGYIDFDAQKIRVIYLNTCDTQDWTEYDAYKREQNSSYDNHSEWISPTQIQWLADTALDFSGKPDVAQWGIVFVGHHPLHHGSGCYGHAMEVIEAYRDGLSGTIKFCNVCLDESDTWQFAQVNYDFSTGERAEIICNIHGHTHNCSMSKISSTSWRTTISEGVTPVDEWLWRIAIPQICSDRYNTGYTNANGDETKEAKYGELDENSDPVYWKKETNTAKATSFCVISIDRSNKKIYAHIFGAGRDRMVSYADDYVPSEYSITVTTENCTVSGDATTITEGESVTLTFVASEGYELPETPVVSGAAYDWNKSNSSLTLSIPIGPVSVSVVAVPETSEPDTPDEPVTSYTNRLPLATTAPNDNTIYGEDYNGDGVNDGYKKDTRYSSSSGIQASAGKQLTGLIPTSEGDIVRVKNIESFEFYIWVKSDGTMSAMRPTSNYVTGYSQPDDNGVYTFNAPSSAFIGARFSGKGITGDTIITVNEPIE